jgi:hypothetical protein
VQPPRHRSAAQPVRTALRALAAATPIALAAGAFHPGVAAAAPPALSYACVPEPSDCNAWYRVPVTLTWTWDATKATPTSDGDCTQRTFTVDTPGTKASCEVTDGLLYTKLTVNLRVDASPPIVPVAVPDRPPDHADWYTRPVSLAFQGSDVTSGIASCDTIAYAGPDGAGVPVVGACRDVAGNVSMQTFRINYDATAPDLAVVRANPGDGYADVRWRASPDAARVEIVREPGPPGPIFTGIGDRYRDDAVANGGRYRYTVRAIDLAGNVRQSSIVVRPASPALLDPASNSHVSGPPLLRWKALPTASFYQVQVYRGTRKVLSAWPRANRLQLRTHWRFGGRTHRLGPGSYRWYVWPAPGDRPDEPYGRLIGSSTFVVVSAP